MQSFKSAVLSDIPTECYAVKEKCSLKTLDHHIANLFEKSTPREREALSSMGMSDELLYVQKQCASNKSTHSLTTKGPLMFNSEELTILQNLTDNNRCKLQTVQDIVSKLATTVDQTAPPVPAVTLAPKESLLESRSLFDNAPGSGKHQPAFCRFADHSKMPVLPNCPQVSNGLCPLKDLKDMGTTHGKHCKAVPSCKELNVKQTEDAYLGTLQYGYNEHLYDFFAVDAKKRSDASECWVVKTPKTSKTSKTSKTTSKTPKIASVEVSPTPTATASVEVSPTPDGSFVTHTLYSSSGSVLSASTEPITEPALTNNKSVVVTTKKKEGWEFIL